MPSPSLALASTSLGSTASAAPLPPASLSIAVPESATAIRPAPDAARPRAYEFDYYTLPPDLSISPSDDRNAAFSAATLPRSSSLLPAPRLGRSGLSSVNAANTANTATATSALAPRYPVHAPATLAFSAIIESESQKNPIPYGPNHRELYSQLHNHNRSRSSSLLLDDPAATPSVPSGPSAASAASAAASAASRAPPPPRDRRPSRSSSVGGGPDVLRNLHRWSSSTASSLVHRHQKSTSFSRRLSVDSIGLQAARLADLPSAPARDPKEKETTPRKLQKSRPSTAGSSQDSPGRDSRQRIPPPRSLPPIVALPAFGPLTVTMASPQQPQRRKPHLRQLSSEDNIKSFYFGDALASATYTGLSTSALPTAHATRMDKPESPARMRSRAVPTSSGSGGNLAYGREPGAHTQTYSRNHSQAKGSSDSSRSRDRDRSAKSPSQKAMLSRALQKANAAVQLDNAGNIEGAREAYAEACALLQQVLLKTQGDDDRRKLEAIRVTYTARIEELNQLVPMSMLDTRPLPKRPQSSHRRVRDALSDDNDDLGSDYEFDEDVDSSPEPVRITTVYADEEPEESVLPRMADPFTVPISSSPILQTATYGSGLLNEQYSLQSSFSRSPRREFHRPSNLSVSPNTLQPPMSNDPYMPPPLSPRRRPTGETQPPSQPKYNDTSRLTAPDVGEPPYNGHVRSGSHESVSWLDPIDESGGSAASSVHSRSSSRITRKRIRAPSGATEAEFDAALDDAIEAAYDDGYDPMSPVPVEARTYDNDIMAQTMRKVELAKERVRESEREARAFEQQLRMRELQQQQLQQPINDAIEGARNNFLDPADESDEEERILEEMTNGYAIEDFAFGDEFANGKQAPHESDSSELTSRTWHSSTGSNPPPTATTVLSTVSENTVSPSAQQSKSGFSGTMPPPMTALAKLPPQSRPALSQVKSDSAQSVRNRRLSGQSMMQLKIDTGAVAAHGSTQAPATATGTVSSSTTTLASASADVPQAPRTAGFLAHQRQGFSTVPVRPGSRAAGEGAGQSGFAPPTPPIPQGPLGDADSASGRAGSPSVNRPTLRKNFSSSSLRSMRGRNMSVTNLEDGSDMSPGTPLNSQFGYNGRLPAMPTLPTPIVAAFKDRMHASSGTGGMFLLESDFHSPSAPGSPNTIYADSPAPLEPCPTDTMLRPFWLMRCLFQTLAHPRGGYLSNKLFVPSDVWRVKGVKLKNIDEKIGNCDLLTAALLKLGQVDTCDADAMLIEMQSLEGVLEQVQAALGRKLGNEVGVQSSNAMFRDASTGGDAEGVGGGNGNVFGGGNGGGSGSVPRTASVSGNRSFSWRRLRSKNSSAGLGGNYASTTGRKESLSGASSGMGKDGLGMGGSNTTLASLPMTASPTSRPVRRDLMTARFTGPHAVYMASLARLFDAAQSIDQIARQVEDPGLRHADKTQVGLELCTRHAAEFFGFYICRFALSDMTILLEKFIKRGSEWVLT